MKRLDWNIEWMNKWYINGSAVAFRDDNPNEGISDVDALAKRVAKLITDYDPDVITIQDAEKGTARFSADRERD